MTAPTPVQFSETLLKELKAFGLPELPASSNARDHAYESNLVGLSFSGGGIRSATFNLGIIQALAQVELLSRFHYLSTVSGGGYVGSWLSALTNRRMDGDIRRTEQAIAEASGLVRPKVLLNSARADTQCAANAIYFLRQFSNYLIPHKRLLSGDSLAALGTYMRNVLINQIILIALFSAAMTLPYFLAWIGHASIGHSYEATFVAGITFSIASSIIGFCVWAQPGLQRHKPSIWWKWQGRLTGVALFLLFFGIFLFTVAVFDIEETKIGPLPVKFLDPLLSPTEQSMR